MVHLQIQGRLINFTVNTGTEDTYMEIQGPVVHLWKHKDPMQMPGKTGIGNIGIIYGKNH